MAGRRGWTIWPKKEVGPDGLEPSTHGEKDLLLRADNAMYKAKREGLGVCRL
jgi:GGDEF domain-containing protein